MKRKFIVLSVFSFMTAAGMHFAHAESLTEKVTTTKSFNVRASTGLLTANLSPNDFTEGDYEDNTLIASYNLSSTIPKQLGLRFTPSVSYQVVTSPLEATLLGANDPDKNKIDVQIYGFDRYTTGTVNNQDYAVTDSERNNISAAITTASAQRFNVDTYTLSIDAAIYTP